MAKFIEGKYVTCTHCDNKIMFDDLAVLQQDTHDDKLLFYLVCPRCGKRIWSEGNLILMPISDSN